MGFGQRSWLPNVICDGRCDYLIVPAEFHKGGDANVREKAVSG